MKKLTVALLVAMAGISGSGALVVAERGKAPECLIVLPADPEPSRVYAAEELRDFVKGITGVTLPVVTNDSPARGVYLDRGGAELGDDGFRLSADGRDLHVVGGKRGVIYGVYELLERFGGVGWFSGWRTVVPEAAGFAVPAALDETHRPAFRLRSTTWRDSRTNHVFRTRLRLNGYDGFDPKFGGVECRFVKGLSSCHTFERLVPQKQYFKDHPEYYSEVNGVRRDGQTQLCLTNPDVLEIVVSNVFALIERDPGAQAVGISQNDWYCYCTCPDCKAIDDEEESHAGALVRFLNAVAERVCARYPKIMVETLAYQYTRKPPKKTRLHPNVMPCLCSIECDFSRPLGSGTKKANEKFRSDIEGWAKLTDNLYLWDYTTNYRLYMHPFANLPVLQENIRFFRDNQVKFLFEEGGCYHADLAELKNWLLAKWMWNPELKYEDLVGRFLKGYFGAAAPYAEEYLKRYLACCKTGTNRHLGCFAFDAPEVFPDDFIAWSLDNWSKAEVAVRDDPGALVAVRMAAAVQLVTQLDRWVAEAPRVWASRNPGKWRLPDGAKVAYDRLMEIRRESERAGRPHQLGNLAVRQQLPIRNWTAMVTKPYPTEPCDRGVVTAGEFDSWNEARGTFEKDAEAFTGKAFKAVNYVNAASAYFNLSNLAFDPEATYRVRVRVKVERQPDGKGEAFAAHLGKHRIAKRTEEIPDDGYHWYPLATTNLVKSMLFEFQSGRYENGGGRTAVKAVWLHQLEFTRVE